MKIPIPEQPYHLSWDITTACNLKCAFCYSASGKSDPAETPELMNLIIDNIVELKPLHLGIGGGEPLLSPYLGEVLQKITGTMRKNTPNITIDSMILYDHKPIIDLVQSLNESLPDTRIGFYVSIHGTEEMHDAMVGIKGHYQNILKGIELLKEHEIRFAMGFVPTRYNIGQIDAVLDLATKVKATVFNVSQFVPVGRGQYNYNLTPQQYRALISWVVLQNKKFDYRYVVTHEHWMGVIDEELFQNELFIGCSAGIYYCGLRSNGDIVPCQLSRFVLGNIQNTKLIEVWQNHPALDQWRKRHIKGKCGKCLFQFKCGGCRCNAVAYTGDFLGEDPLCPFKEDEIIRNYSKLSNLEKRPPQSILFLNNIPEFTDTTLFLRAPALSTIQGAFLTVRHEGIDAFVKLTGDARIIYGLLSDDKPVTLKTIRKMFKEKTDRDLNPDEFLDMVKYKLILWLE